VAWVLTQAGQFKPDDVVIINLSGRGDKDVDSFIQYRPDSIL
jgi:tryptophan synthase beta chain